jgi:hypothetical protein
MILGAFQDPVERIGEGFRAQTGSSESGVVLLAVAGAAVVAALFLVLALWSRRGPGRALFGELARANGLTGRESKLLFDLAVRTQPDDPAAIFVRRSAFESGALDLAVDAATLDALRRKVYGP